jgi:hypothetical protein
MGTPVDQMPIEIAVGDLETRYVEMGEMGLRQFAASTPAGCCSPRCR